MTAQSIVNHVAVRRQPGEQPRGRQPVRWPVLAGLAGFALFVVPLRGTDLAGMNGLGLISVLPLASLAGLALQVLAFVALLARRRPAPVLLGGMLVLIICCLAGVTGLVEPLPRFATSYQVSGFISYIQATGHAPPGLTAYFSWPGFLALIAFAAKAAGVSSLLPLMTWWPVLIDLALLPPFLLLARALRINWRARWFAALLLCAGNWVGQDYFSPQSFNFLLYLVFVAILLTWFSGVSQVSEVSQPSLRSGELPAVAVGAGQRAILLAIVTGIFTVSVVSHQLTPFLMLAACAGLVIVGRCAPRTLPVLLAVILIGWVSYQTVGYWSGHMSAIFGDIGSLGGNFSSSVSSRIIGTPVHRLIDYSRVGLAVAMLAAAAAGLLRRRRRGIADRALTVLLVAPVSIAALQNYGGEISMRIYLFALPAAALLTASLFFPEPRQERPEPAQPRPERQEPAQPRAGAAASKRGTARIHRPAWSLVAGGLVAVLLAWLFMFARYGNEAFEQTPRGELAAMNYIYRSGHGEKKILWLSRPAGQNATPQMPWQFRDLSQAKFVSMSAPRDPAATARVARYLASLGPHTFLITTSTEATYLRQTASFDPVWDAKFRAAMNNTKGVRLMLGNKDAAVYTAARPAGPPAGSASRAHPAPPDGSVTVWSPIGIAALFLAIVLLGARELIRACSPARRCPCGQHRRRDQRSCVRCTDQRPVSALMRPLGVAAIPAVALLLIAVAERFAVLS